MGHGHGMLRTLQYVEWKLFGKLRILNMPVRETLGLPALGPNRFHPNHFPALIHIHSDDYNALPLARVGRALWHQNMYLPFRHLGQCLRGAVEELIRNTRVGFEGHPEIRVLPRLCHCLATGGLLVRNACFSRNAGVEQCVVFLDHEVLFHKFFDARDLRRRVGIVRQGCREDGVEGDGDDQQENEKKS